MNLKLYKLFGLVNFLPVWVFRGNFNYIDVLILLVFFYLIPYFIHSGLIVSISKNNKGFNYLILSFYLALICTYSMDQHLTFWSVVLYISKLKILPIFVSIKLTQYLLGMVYLFIVCLIVFLFIFLFKKNGQIIVLFFIITVLSFNILDFKKNISSFPQVNTNNSIINLDGDLNKKLVIIFDEMSGINSFESSHPSGLKTKKKLKDLFDKYQFTYYPNAQSISSDTKTSIPSMLNFVNSMEQYSILESKIPKNKKLFVEKSNNFFIEHEVTSNKFFDSKHIKNIVIYQNMFLNYCNHYKVIKCYQYNPFDQNNKYVDGFKNNFLTRFLSAYKYSLSVVGRIFWRASRQLRFSDSTIEPMGQKATLPYLFNKIEDSLSKEKANLTFVYLLAPHSPYVFDKNCKYDGSISIGSARTVEEYNIFHHNQERDCMVYFLDIFFNDLQKKEFWKRLEIFIISDHGSRIKGKDDERSLSAIFAVKTKNIEPGLKKNKIKTNYLFNKLNNY